MMQRLSRSRHRLSFKHRSRVLWKNRKCHQCSPIFKPVDLHSLIRHAASFKLWCCNGRQLHIYQQDSPIWPGRHFVRDGGKDKVFEWHLERRGSVTVALTWARTLVLPSVTCSPLLNEGFLENDDNLTGSPIRSKAD